jgi:hypothetical protein
VEEEKRPSKWFYLLIIIGLGLGLMLFEMFLNWLLPGTRV